MSSRVELKVVLPVDRVRSGTMHVYVNGQLNASFEVLGRGSAGPGDTQFQNKGNTPTGTWKATGWQSTAGQSQRSYGSEGKVILQPTGGNASVAHESFARDLFRIHGGDLGGKNSLRGEGQLRPTHGCLRLSNDDMKRLYNLIFNAGLNEKEARCEDPIVTVEVVEGEGEGDAHRQDLTLDMVFEEWRGFVASQRA